jgi:hypothetical protein
MVPLVGGTWGEVRMLAIGALDTSADPASDGRATDLSYFARLTDAATFTRLATVETHRRGTERAAAVAGVVDGALWCQTFLDVQCHDAARILDIGHALAALGQVAQAVHGSGTDGASAWLGAQAHALRHGDEDAVLAELLDQMTLASTPGIRDVVEETYGYLAARQEQLRYARFRAAGYPIGSGCVESANKLVVQARLTGGGMHWSRAAVNPMLALRPVLASGRWDAEWARLWAAWRQQPRARAARRCRARAQPAAPASLLAPPSPPPVPAAPPAPPRLKTIVNGKPTPNHPWRRSSPFRAKS